MLEGSYDDYAALPKFHNSFVCPRTAKTVGYADCGDPNGLPVLYVLPSMCSRLLCLLLDLHSSAKGVRLIAMDRPGMGLTDSCDISERVVTSTSSVLLSLEATEADVCAAEMHLSLLEHLNLDSVKVFTHSACVLLLVEVLCLLPTHVAAVHCTHCTSYPKCQPYSVLRPRSRSVHHGHQRKAFIHSTSYHHSSSRMSINSFPHSYPSSIESED